MKYQTIFGIYGIVVNADNDIEAKSNIIKKFNGYKNGSRKKEYIRNKINKDFNVLRVYLKNGFYRET